MKTNRIPIALLAFAVLAAAAFGVYRGFLHATPVQTVAARQGAMPVRITGPGTVQARIPVTLGARVTATVTAVHADHGDSVKRGQLLAQLDDRDLSAKRASVTGQQDTLQRNAKAARANIVKAQADVDLARSKKRRDAELFATGYLSQASLDASDAALRAAEANLDNTKETFAAREAETGTLSQEARFADAVLSFTRIAAPMDGVIIQRLAEVGSTVVPGSPMFRMVDPATLWVATRIDESVVGRVRPGMPASIRLRTGEVLPGKVARIARQSDAATRELEVNVAFDVPPERFAIDQEAEVTIHAGEDKGLMLPIGALVQYQGKQGVMIVRDGRAQFQAVETGAADTATVLVRKGVAAEDAVIAAPQSVKPGMRVRGSDTPG
ncbi:MAG: efflux RND transporter periplasmic adaptor subunit [Betaproteobacteria bacterium]|nr:efflux RND transporter periplasmic adaptor subunit [Betaproteobacteria bacterium]